MWGPCACPRWDTILLYHYIRNESCGEQDRHKAPTHPCTLPLSLQNRRVTFFVILRFIVKYHQNREAGFLSG